MIQHPIPRTLGLALAAATFGFTAAPALAEANASATPPVD